MRARAVFVALLVALTASCSFVDDFSRFTTDAGAPPVDGGLTLDQFLARFTSQLCARAAYCESKLRVGALLEVFCNPGVVSDELGAVMPLPPGEHYDAAAAQACLDALAPSMDCSVTRPLLPEACQRIVVGSSMDGSPCHIGPECQSGTCTTIGGCGGICGRTGGGAMGTTCTANAQCAAGLVCRGAILTCQPPGTPGDTCDEQSDCADTYWCTPSHACAASPDVGMPCDATFGADPCSGALVCTGTGAAARCMDGRTEGQSCDAATPCAPGLRCSPTSSTCKTLSPPGGPCSSRENCPLAFTCTSTVCMPAPVLGEHCDGLTPCAIGSCAAGGTCAPGGMDTPCDPLSPVIRPCAGYCDPTVMACKDPLASGASCTSYAQCMTGYDCIGTPTTCTACM